MIARPTPTTTPLEAIRIRGARTHNLKNINLDIPHHQLVVITGPSGSGKSSLAFDTLFAEGQRQYIESLSVHARQFIHQMQRPDVDLIDGLPPTLSIDQHPQGRNPRSTLATLTEIHDYLRLLFARVSVPHCPQCDRPICRQTPDEIVGMLAALPEGTRAMILAPFVRDRRGRHAEVLAAIQKAGFVRVRIDGVTYPIEEAPALAGNRRHTIEAVVDRVIIREGSASRWSDSVRLAVRHGQGLVVLSWLEGAAGTERRRSGGKPAAREGRWHDRLLSTEYGCPDCGVRIDEVEPRTFSFNSPYGACPTCQGLGVCTAFDPDLVIPDRRRSLSGGAIAPWRKGSGLSTKRVQAQWEAYLKRRGIDPALPVEQLGEATIAALLYGDRRSKEAAPFPGILTLLDKELATATRASRREQLEAYRGSVRCPECQGARLGELARRCLIGEWTIDQVSAMTIDRAVEFFRTFRADRSKEPIARPIVAEIVGRLEFLQRVGAGYLSLDRPADTLSGGELQRVRLATGIGSGLVGICYLLDEPSIGLHPRDNQRLIDALRRLKEEGNTVVVVEHDAEMMRQADHLIDLGPAAGGQGGRVVAHGTPEQVRQTPASLTGQYLDGRRQVPLPAARRPVVRSRSLRLIGASLHNLKEVDCQVPLGLLVCVTGVSGSGKSSLVLGTLAPAVARRLGQGGPKPGPHRGLRGVAALDRMIHVDQTPIGRSPRSCPASYCGVLDEVRGVFARTKGARRLGFRAGRFSFNSKAGQCEACRGRGEQRIEMNFLPDLIAPCPQCGGRRFNRQTLQVRYRDHTIADVLEMDVDRARTFFANVAKIDRMLDSLQQIGLGYLKLGQPAPTLSGGEAQRIKLATQLGRPASGHTLYILDEPTTGLHFSDVQRLMGVLDQLVDQDNTVLVIEHNLDVIKCADWIIDLGPDGGEAGGRITAAGTPEEIARLEENHTGRFLARAGLGAA